MWNPFRKRDQRLPGKERAVRNRIDELWNQLYQSGRAADLERELERIDRSTLSSAEEEAWHHLYGICAFQNGRDAEALRRFATGYESFPDSAMLRFSLAQQCERAREVDRAFALFSGCRFPDVPAKYALAQARYAYLWNRYDEGRACLRPIFEAYKQAIILDDHFLYIRGLPFYQQWWSYMVAFSVLTGDWGELEDITHYTVNNCQDVYEHLELAFRAYREGTPEILIDTLEHRLQHRAEMNGPQAYTCMQIAIINAREAATQEDSEAMLDAAQITNHDFPWLEDIRTLAKADIAHRFAQAQLERDRVQTFLNHQPLLFEPDHAVDFWLLEYQERLKPHYQGRTSL